MGGASYTLVIDFLILFFMDLIFRCECLLSVHGMLSVNFVLRNGSPLKIALISFSDLNRSVERMNSGSSAILFDERELMKVSSEGS